MTKQTKLKRVLIMAGGTGGHVFPGIAFARYLQAQNVEVHWLGTQQGIEAQVIPAANIPLHFIKISGLRGKGIKPLLTVPYKLLKAVYQAFTIIRAIQPDVVIGMGGFASGPGGLASWLSGTPLVIHEQNAKSGFTNRILAKIAKRVLLGFPQKMQSGSKYLAIGNPVRSEITALQPPNQRLMPPRMPFNLLIIGGSLGALALNETVPAGLALLPPEERPNVRHQTGKKHLSQTQLAYKNKHITANLQPFIEDMAEAYNWADLILCRAGASTIAELCAIGLGAILIPYPHAVDDHQTANAAYMVDGNAAICIQQRELTPERLAAIVREFGQSPKKRIAMAEAAFTLRQMQVVEKMYAICGEISS